MNRTEHLKKPTENMERQKRTQILRVRIRPSEEAMFKRMASIHDMSVSDYVRRVLKHQVKKDVEIITRRDKVS